MVSEIRNLYDGLFLAVRLRRDGKNTPKIYGNKGNKADIIR